MKIIRILWSLFCFILSVFLIIDAVFFVNNPHEYPIGEGISWYYQSNANYLLSSTLFILWLLIGCILGIMSFNQKNHYYLGIHVSITIIYILILINSSK